MFLDFGSLSSYSHIFTARLAWNMSKSLQETAEQIAQPLTDKSVRVDSHQRPKHVKSHYSPASQSVFFIFGGAHKLYFCHQ